MKCAGFSADGVYQIRHASGSLADIGKTYKSGDTRKLPADDLRRQPA